MADTIAALLNRAITEGNIDECRRLVDVEGADIHEEDKRRGWTPIVWACNGGYLDILEYLVSKGARVNDKSDRGLNCLMWACICSRLNFAEFLMSKGANIHELDNYECSCFSLALKYNHINVLYRLRKWPTTMAILVLQELALIYIIDSESVIDLHQYLGRPDDLKTDNEEDYIKDKYGNVL